MAYPETMVTSAATAEKRMSEAMISDDFPRNQEMREKRIPSITDSIRKSSEEKPSNGPWKWNHPVAQTSQPALADQANSTGADVPISMIDSGFRGIPVLQLNGYLGACDGHESPESLTGNRHSQYFVGTACWPST
jgi:hypothetical protein